MNASRWINLALYAYAGVVFVFIFTPIATSIVFSLNVDRFPSLPLGGFSLKWYQDIFTDANVWRVFGNSLQVGVTASIVATAFGFGAAYTDYRYRFFGRSVYLTLALLPPTIPVVIMGLAMLAFLSRVDLSGDIHAVMISHIVMCTPFAMAVIRMRLAQMPSDLEAAAWNLGAGQWRALRHVILPFTAPSIAAALFVTLAVSFDEYAVAWFVSGLDGTVPTRVLTVLQGRVNPTVYAIGSIAFAMTMTLIILAYLLSIRWGQSRKRPAIAAAEGDQDNETRFG